MLLPDNLSLFNTDNIIIVLLNRYYEETIKWVYDLFSYHVSLYN